MVGSGPGGLLYPYVVRGYRKSTSPAQEELFGHRRGRLGRQVVGLPSSQRSWEPGIAAWTRSPAALNEPGLLAPPTTRGGHFDLLRRAVEDCGVGHDREVVR
jgi:hypothetical protein